MKKLSFEIPDRDDRGVSPVIGVILMVAITVILAAVIASFVLGFGDDVTQNVQAGADISQNDDNTGTVTWISEGSADELTVSAEGETISTLSSVGDSVEINDSHDDNTDGEVDVTVVAVGSGGAETVIVQGTVNV